MKISKNRFPEMDEDVYIESTYPIIQINIFPKNLTELNKYDNIGIIASTTFNNKIFWEFISVTYVWYQLNDNIINDLKDRVKQSVFRII